MRLDRDVEALRNVNQIKDPHIHESAVNIIVEVVDILLRAEEELDYADYESGMWIVGWGLGKICKLITFTTNVINRWFTSTALTHQLVRPSLV